MTEAEPFPLPLTGECRCGGIQYRITAAPRFIMACHCTDCRQLSSSAFSLGMAVPREGFALLQGTPRCWEKVADSGGWSRQFTCPVCAGWTHTETEHAAAVTIVRPGTLHAPGWVRPVAQLFTRSALPWALLDVALSYAGEFEDTGPLERAFAESGIRPQGRG